MASDEKIIDVSNILSIIPPLSSYYHKGEAGRIGIIGGSMEYTGAPYFAAISAMRTGCDLAHVFCTKDAALAIKSYSPELIVHPLLDSINAIEQFSEILPRLHAVVVGPGLGREKHIFEMTRQMISLIKKRDLPLVLDADALFFLKDSLDVIAFYKKAIITPNEMEFNRLYNAVMKNKLSKPSTMHNVKELSAQLGNVAIVKKGLSDYISNGDICLEYSKDGSPRRCGGQGDILSGSMGVFNYWAHKSNVHIQIPYSATVLAALGACMLTRKCGYLAFQKFKRSTLTSDMISEIQIAFSNLFPSE